MLALCRYTCGVKGNKLMLPAGGITSPENPITPLNLTCFLWHPLESSHHNPALGCHLARALVSSMATGSY